MSNKEKKCICAKRCDEELSTPFMSCGWISGRHFEDCPMFIPETPEKFTPSKAPCVCGFEEARHKTCKFCIRPEFKETPPVIKANPDKVSSCCGAGIIISEIAPYDVDMICEKCGKLCDTVEVSQDHKSNCKLDCQLDCQPKVPQEECNCKYCKHFKKVPQEGNKMWWDINAQKVPQEECSKFDCSKHNDGYGLPCDDDHNPISSDFTTKMEEFDKKFIRKANAH